MARFTPWSTKACKSIFHSVQEHEYTYTIMAPSYVVLDLDGDDGDIEITGWRGDIDCALDDGDVELADVENGRTRIGLEDGDVAVDGLIGELVVSGDDGDVVLTDCRFLFFCSEMPCVVHFVCQTVI